MSSLPSPTPPENYNVHPGNFRHDLAFRNQLPPEWSDLYFSLIQQAEMQVRMLFGTTVLHTMLIERAAFLYVKQKVMDQLTPEEVVEDPKFESNYNALLRQFLKVTEQLSKYESAAHITPEAAFLYTVMEVVNAEVKDPGDKRRIGERLLALRKPV